ncbi:MAG: GDSL-like Lipase/Acylhydrolase [Phycisphaerales bacterium]|nr:GDSL-like Lipase/Acylhydrolase [Phycisphaerales bacterium]
MTYLTTSRNQSSSIDWTGSLRRVACIAALAIGCGGGMARAESDAAPAAKLNDGERVAVLGDSITEQKNYSVIIENYLLACQPAAGIQTAQFGWGGETTWGLAPRMAQDVLWFKPTVATINYGMNDGGYGKVDAKRLADYREKTKDIIQQLKASGTRLIIVGGPGAVDTDAFRTIFAKGHDAAVTYNKTLATFGDAAKEVAQQEGVVYADLHTIMADAMVKFKATYPDKSFVGNDGIHPENVGHTIMAYAFLKAMGCDGNIGTITVDLAGHKADATAGHKVVSMENDTLTIESSRYPFSVRRDVDALGIGSAMNLVPFDEDLNRFQLVLSGVPAGKHVKVTWSEVPVPAAEGMESRKTITVSRDFDAAELAKGINLAASFPTTPFENAFSKLDAAVHAQQDFETPLNKQWLHRQKAWVQEVPSAAEKFNQLADAAKQFDDRLRAVAGAVVVPVKHTLRFEVQ